MKASLYVSNEKLVAVTGVASETRATVKGFATAKLPEGALINGVITDDRLFALALTELREKLPKKALDHPFVAVRSNQIYEKRMAVPPIKSQKLLEWIAGEFAEVGSGEPLVCDYSVIETDPKGGRIALLCAAQKKLVESYIALFEREGMPIASLDTALSAQIKLVRLLQSTRDKTLILAEFDGNRLDASLFVAGNYHFNNSVRLFAERGTEESAAEVGKLVSSIIQFNTADRSGQAVTDVFVTGLRPNEAGLLDRIKASFSVEAAVLEDDGGAVSSPGDRPFVLSEYAYAVGNLIEP